MAERHEALELDVADPLAGLRARFRVPDGLIYLDGNSLGALPVGVAAAVARTVEQEWGVDLIRSWNTNGWWEAPARLGDRIGGLVGAAPGQVVVCDSTSVNLYKLLVAARRLRPECPAVLVDADDFPSDRYIVGSVAGGSVAGALGPDVGVVVRSHVNYRSGRLHDMASLTAEAHDRGALVLWDLSHSVGVVPVELDAAGVDLAVGCTYKYLNGGRGRRRSPTWPAATRRRCASRWRAGWATPSRFAMAPDYEPAPGILRLLTGTPPIVSMAALRRRSTPTTAWPWPTCGPRAWRSRPSWSWWRPLRDGFALASPAAAAERGPGVPVHPEAYPIVQALIARNVIADFREPDILRFSFAPLYCGSWTCGTPSTTWWR